MLKKLLITSFFSFSLISIFYPAKKENTKLFDFCYSLEKILSRNSIQKRKNVSLKIKSISGDIAEFGVSQTRGVFINKMIDQYKRKKNSLIIKNLPNNLYCYAGYWIENVKPGTLESILYAKTKNSINEFKDLKDEVEGVLDNINSEFEVIKNNLNSIF